MIHNKTITIKVDFEGGLENDFNARDGIKVEISEGMKLNELPLFLSKKYLNPSKPTRFIDSNGTLLPGILVMINEVDSEIDGTDVVLEKNDNVTYISTLHGG